MINLCSVGDCNRPTYSYVFLGRKVSFPDRSARARTERFGVAGRGFGRVYSGSSADNGANCKHCTRAL